MATETLHLTILSPEREVFQGDILRGIFPSVRGDFEVLPQHAALMAMLNAGDIVFYLPTGEEIKHPITGGYLEVLNNRITVCIEA